jgi:hypothetical protein
MDKRPSLILPSKRSRCANVPQTRAQVVVKVSENNSLKRFSDEEEAKIATFMSLNPGEFYTVEYWKHALVLGLTVKTSAEGLRLRWLKLQTENRVNTEFSLSITEKKSESINKRVENVVSKAEKKIVVACKQGIRSVYDLEEMQQMVKRKNYLEEFRKVVEICRKSVRKELSEWEVMQGLMNYQGNSTETIANFMSCSTGVNLQSVFEDCCSLSKQELTYERFLSLYVGFNGGVTSLYNFCALRSQSM